MIVLIYIHFWYLLAYWHLITVVESSWTAKICSYHVSLGSTRTIPCLVGWVSLVRRETVSGITCGSVWGFIALAWRMIELQVWANTKTSKCNGKDCKYNYSTRWIYLKLLMKEPKSTVIHTLRFVWQSCLLIYLPTLNINVGLLDKQRCKAFVYKVIWYFEMR